MEEIIRRIISIEDKAQAIVSDARAAKGALDGRIKSEDRKMAMRIRKEAAEKCRQIQQTEYKGVNERLDEINESTRAQLAELEEKYSENKDRWVETMVQHIIGE